MERNLLVPMERNPQYGNCSDVYQQLEAELLLSCCSSGEIRNRSFAKSHASISEALKTGSFYLLLSSKGVPRGYATWNVKKNGNAELVEFVAPFGDQSELAKHIEQHLSGIDIDKIQGRNCNMEYVKSYALYGYAMELLVVSSYYSEFEQHAYMRQEVFPACVNGQLKIFLTDEGFPIGLVTRAWLNEEVEGDVLATGRALKQHEWRSGDRLFFNDFIAPYGSIREIRKDLTKTMYS